VSKYDHLDKDALVRLLTRRDTERQLGLVWERDDIDPDAAINDDYVALDLDPALSHGDAPWRNLIIEGDNYDALRALRMSHAGRIRCIYIDPPYNTGNRDFATTTASSTRVTASATRCGWSSCTSACAWPGTCSPTTA
jgi:adenine-specific DNA-methyltransferase